MDSLTVTDQPRSDLPEDFDLGSYVKSRFDMYRGETVTVTLRFANHLRNVVIDRFGTDAHMRADGGDTFSLTAPVEVGPTFYGWLFQFGSEAEILTPQETRAGFADYCRQVLARYE